MAPTKKKKAKTKTKTKKRSSNGQTSAAAHRVYQWAWLSHLKEASASAHEEGEGEPDSLVGEFFVPPSAREHSLPPLVTDFHTHTTCSDGMLTPVELVQKAYRNKVQVLALTDHDTMAGVPAALEAARKCGIRLIPGVEISAKISGRVEENVHILAYYSCCGPSKFAELEESLSKIREGRFHRAQNMVNKLQALKVPIRWERVLAIAGVGVAPGRVHIARALVEAGYVGNTREAFSKYLHDGGPAYAAGTELAAEEAVKLVCRTGGISALAHPWALKDPLSVAKRLKSAGLHAMEVYKWDGKVAALAGIADAYQLVKIGGSDYHGRGGSDETGLGKVALPTLAVHEFLGVAQPIWCSAIRSLLHDFSIGKSEDKPGESSLSSGTNNSNHFSSGHLSTDLLKGGDMSLGYTTENDASSAFLRLSTWLTKEEKLTVDEASLDFKLSQKILHEEGQTVCIVT